MQHTNVRRDVQTLNHVTHMPRSGCMAFLFLVPPAQVLPLPDELLLKHATLFEDYKNVSHWPKHVLIHYRFRNEGDIDFNNGLYVFMLTGLVLFVLLSFNTLAGVQAKVAQLLKDVVGTEYDPLVGSAGSTPPGDGGSQPQRPYIPFKAGAHVE
eukprot:GHRR01022480.1.p2 GENE.GHRR01022480.1~~GHRR01022480.1.p2  ORF type:complete len:154 (+),score=36.74 GHRR01022480.1:706-1167(+)